uniref:Cation-transporting P-type ATPase C-terminal domain-containing protein n=1 Tax=Octactis speculum TaxID=3111310 RepID=A0A7S2H593_9STRA
MPIYCKFAGGNYVNEKGEIDLSRSPRRHAPRREYPIWDEGDGGAVETCIYPVKNYAGSENTPENFLMGDSSTYEAGDTAWYAMPTIESIEAMENHGYFEYIPWRSRLSEFWRDSWLSYDIQGPPESYSSPQIPDNGKPDLSENEIRSYFEKMTFGLWSICIKDPHMKRIVGKVNTAHTPEQLEAIQGWNASDYANGGSSWGCRKEGDALYGSLYPADNLYGEALFCNGDGSYYELANFSDPLKRKRLRSSNFRKKYFPKLKKQDPEAYKYLQYAMKCAELNDHPSNVQYCYDECSLRCEQMDSEMRLNNTARKKQCYNIASRMTQIQAGRHARTAFFLAVVLCQFSAAISLRTRWQSIYYVGFDNRTINAGLYAALLIAVWVIYSPMLNVIFSMAPIRFAHCFAGAPFAILFFIYEEVRKALMRGTSKTDFHEDNTRGSTSIRRIGWLEHHTFY